MIEGSKPGFLVLTIALLIDIGLLVDTGMQCHTADPQARGPQPRGPQAHGPLFQAALGHIGLIEGFTAGYLAHTTTTLIGIGLPVGTVGDRDSCGKE